MRVLVAPDKFKGSLTAEEAAAHMVSGWRTVQPKCDLTIHPIADGGDGTLDVLQQSTGGTWREFPATDARGNQRPMRWLWHEPSRRAWIEIAQVAGLAGLDSSQRDPLTATTAGIGDLVVAAAKDGAQTIYLCLGGSATNDAGCGMAAALGFRFLDAQGHSFQPVPAELHRLHRIERPKHFPQAHFIGLTDVQNPLLGANGASHVYGPQKGASAAQVHRLEEALARVALVAGRDLSAPAPDTPGAGAAGGLGYGVMAFLGGKLASGFDTVAELTGLPEKVAAADLVLTGEGKIDAQTFAGKGPAGVARLAARYGKPVIALAGSVPLTKVSDFDAIIPISHEPMTLEQSMQQAGPLLELATARLANLLRVGQLL